MSEKFILLIEDNEDISNALVWALEYEGYKVVAMKNGEDALAFLEKDPRPSLIFLDLMMPVLNGFEFRKRQQSDPRLRDIPTVICSAKNNFYESELNLPHEVFLPKPFQLNKLCKIIKKYW